MRHPEDGIGSLESARVRLYKPGATAPDPRTPLAEQGKKTVRHAWGDTDQSPRRFSKGRRRVHIAGVFFIATFLFFLVSLAVAGYFFYFGGNSVSVEKVSISIQGPTTIAGGDTVPLSITIINKNPVAIENATIEITFPDGTRDASDVLKVYPRYTENLGVLESGAVVTRSVKAVIFGQSGQTLSLPVSLVYKTSGSNAVFEKKSSYPLVISTTPLSVSIDTLAETVSGKPLTLTLTVRSNATVPISNVVLAGSLPFGFLVTSSSLPFNNSSFFIGTLLPGATQTIQIVGTLSGQQNEQRVFRFTLGTAKSSDDHTLAITYMIQDTSVTLSAPFLDTSISLNGDTSNTMVITPKSFQSATVSYTNTLPTSVTNAVISVVISGDSVDYDSIRTTSGFYRSTDHTIVFSRDTDPALAILAPGASGIGAFTFSTLAGDLLPIAPTITFTISVSGTRFGQTNVPEVVTSSATRVVKIATTVLLGAASLHSSGPFSTTGPIPPQANEETTYAVVLQMLNKGSAVAGGMVSTILPSYVSYIEQTAGTGSFSYDKSSRTVSWNTGDVGQGRSVQGAFLVSLTPSTSQRGDAPALTGGLTFSGYDRFAGVQVKAEADAVTTETKGDPGYVNANAVVQ